MAIGLSHDNSDNRDKTLRYNESAKPLTPRTTRLKLDEANAELTEAEADYDRLKAEFEAEDARITKRRQSERRRHEAKLAALRETREAADTAYREATIRWRSEDQS